MIVAEFPLRGAGGEPISFERTVYSHGLARLEPAAIVPGDASRRLAYRRRFSTTSGVVEAALRPHAARLRVEAEKKIGKRAAAEVASSVRRMFRLDDD